MKTSLALFFLVSIVSYNIKLYTASFLLFFKYIFFKKKDSKYQKKIVWENFLFIK